jgi:hypothetical protein
MSNNNYIKGECQTCAGHLEFPADATGETIDCPHCGVATVLTAGRPVARRRKIRLVLAAALLLLLCSGVLLAVHHRKAKPDRKVVAVVKPVATVTPTPAAADNTPPPAPAPVADAERTNDFGISPLKLENTPGSSLVYVTGRVRNLAARQRFGVKIECRLFDADGGAVGAATDYQPVLDPFGGWNFKALVMESRAKSAEFGSIIEQP